MLFALVIASVSMWSRSSAPNSFRLSYPPPVRSTCHRSTTCHAAAGLELSDQVVKRRFITKDGVNDLTDRVIGSFKRCLGNLSQQAVFASHAAEVSCELLDDLLLGPGADPVHGRDQ